MEFEKMIDQLPLSITCDVCGSFSENATTSFGQSQGSSKMDHSTSNESWMSESSCDCHSSRGSTLSKSHLIFYNHCILPPLLCSTTRTEMQTYRKKAVEKEKKRRLDNSNKKESEVDPNYSGVDSLSTFEKQNESSFITKQENIETAEDQENASQNQTANEKIDSASPLARVDLDILNDTDVESCPTTHEEENEDLETQFQEDAYRHSLQNLLHKSLNLNETANTTCSLDQPHNAVMSGANESGDAISTLTPASLVRSGGCGLKKQLNSSENATQSVIPDVNRCEVSSQVIDAADSTKCNHSTEVSNDGGFNDGEEEKMRLLLNKTVEDLVESVLASVKSEFFILPEISDSSYNHPTDHEPPKTPNESPLKSNSVQCPYFPPHSSNLSSPYKATEQIDKALSLIENQFLQQYKSEKRDNCSKSSNSAPHLPTEASSFSPVLSKDSNYSEHLSLQETEVVVVESLSDSSQLELQIASDSYFESVDQDNPTVTTSIVPVPQLCESPGSSTPPAPTPESRIRRDSFSVDTPSSLLLSSRSTHTIYSENLTSNPCEVKRKLDLQSDSEESLLSNAITDISLRTIQISERTRAPDYYQLLEDQHKKEMFDLQLHHQEQLTQYRKRFLNCQVFSADQLYAAEDTFEQVDPALHLKWCKFSALIKGHLIRKLLGSLPVQSCMKTIRDTSRTILAMKSEDTSSSTNMSAIQDATLMNRLFSQLRAAMYDFHSFFFDTPTSEQMDIISKSRAVEARTPVLKEANRTKLPRLSAATQKSLQRKKDNRKRKEEKRSSDEMKKNSLNERHRNQHKEVKSKVSTFWKIGSSKKTSKPSSKNKTKGPHCDNDSYCSPGAPISSRKSHRV